MKRTTNIICLIAALLLVNKVQLVAQNYVACKTDAYVGLCDEEGNLKIKLNYDDIETYGYTKTVVVKKGKLGMVDLQTGKEIIPCKYEKIYPCAYYSNSYLCKENGFYFFYNDSTKKEFSPRFEVKENDNPMNIDGGVCYAESDSWVLCKIKGKWGLMTCSGKELIAFKYDQLDIGGPYYKNETLLASENGKFGIIDSTGKKISSFEYTDALGDWDTCYVLKKGAKWIFLDKNMKERDKLPGDSLMYKGLYHDNKCALFNSRGEQLSPFGYQYIITGKENCAVADEKGSLALMNYSGKVLSPFAYDRIEMPYYESEGDLIQFTQKEKYGLMDKYGKVVTDELYEYIFNRADFKIVTKNNKSGYLDYKGKLAIPCIYEDVYFFGEGDMAGVKKDNKWGFINRKGEVVIPLKYDKMDYFRNGFSKIELNGRTGKLDIKGNEIWD